MTPTLTVTVDSPEEFATGVEEDIQALEAGQELDAGHTVSFPSQDLLMETFTPTRLALLRTIAEQEPGSIRETARLVDRDVKNVHEDLTRLEKLGVVDFEADGRAKRPLFPFDEIAITVEFDVDSLDTESTAPT